MGGDDRPAPAIPSLIRKTENIIAHFDAALPNASIASKCMDVIASKYSVTQVGSAALAVAIDMLCPHLIVLPHGPYFPTSAWQNLLRYLQLGGNLFIINGPAFSRPFESGSNVYSWTDEYASELFLAPFVHIDADMARSGTMHVSERMSAAGFELGFRACGEYWSPTLALTQSTHTPSEPGSDGPMDTICVPLAHVVVDNLPIATPWLLLDHKGGKFSGGRWVLGLQEYASVDDVLASRQLLLTCFALSLSGVAAVEIFPAPACLFAGEPPLLQIVWTSPHADILLSAAILSDSGRSLYEFERCLPRCSFEANTRHVVPLAKLAPGYYDIQLSFHSLLPMTADQCMLKDKSGFWVFDNSVVKNSSVIAADASWFTIDSRRAFLAGSSYMCSRYHRQFLRYPNPACWMYDLRMMAQMGVNIIRTGLWTGWYDLAPAPGQFNDSYLRALDAWMLCATSAGLLVQFTLFSFQPPSWGGMNPWFDPIAVQAQELFVSKLAARYSIFRNLSWDIINEPSMGSAKRLWADRPRPSGDVHEKAVYVAWLKAAVGDGELGLVELRSRWRMTTSVLGCWDDVTVPQETSFSTSVGDSSDHWMCRVIDWTLFTQVAFTRWAEHLHFMLKSAGASAIIGVGQDEAFARPSPLFHGPSMDYTATHPWWNNNDILYDIVMARIADCPCLVQEVGVMLARQIDNISHRDVASNARLLERKLYTGLGSGSAGIIQWCWFTNALMASPNERQIGLVCADGSCKPEAFVYFEFLKATQAWNKVARHHLGEAPSARVWLIVPVYQGFARPELTVPAIQRCVRILLQTFDLTPLAIPECKLAQAIEECATGHATATLPKYVIAPSLQFVGNGIEKSLQTLANLGAMVIVSGHFANDPYGRSREGHIAVPVQGIECIEQLGVTASFQKSGKGEYLTRDKHIRLIERVIGAGKYIHCGVPVESADDDMATTALYALAMTPRADELPPGISVLRHCCGEYTLYCCINESSSDQTIPVGGSEMVCISAGRSGAVLVRARQVESMFGGVACV